MVTGVLDVICAMGVVGVALVTGMADVAHGGSRRGARPGSPAAVRHSSPDRRGRPVSRHPAPHRPGHGGCAQLPERGDGA
ncbi:hypothetical protein BX264_4733 [Streptomyces sp. 2333.5]|uniref:hypothetical protein n=1 Tax=Streptomyces TaxID=1883 RepID=UPI00089B4C60|nr:MULTISPECIES: hypothetical protein [unclassified Streptomyces]PJJ04328.1 hypothetical protein BX264_4733 [Streptomyces sp. 2333.5]SEE47648.1 hypothetical protein SAMN05428943_4844 [Streptomyces sp. 2314.4]SEE74558.1 hypothetical protein SAMN05428942_4834 [Streptomyces sp. 2112.2]SOE11326.1 hypothetical protein SAMN06272775_2332 [Streptomyces sp. 2323.1]